MADEKPAGKPDVKPAPAPEKKDDITEMIWLLLAVFLFFTFVSSLMGFFNSNKLFSMGWRGFTPQGLLLSTTKPISSLLNPINSKFVVTSKEAPLYDTPGGKQIGTKKMGDEGTIIGGPVNIGGEKYWQVKFEDGSNGWISEEDIAVLPQKLTPMSKMSTLVGTPVETSKDTPVFSEPGVNQIATQKAGSRATIIEGPIIKDGVKYWHVRFDDGTVGWVAEDNLDSLKMEKQSLSSVSNPIGGRVSVSKGPTDVFAEPGGQIIGTEPVSATGEVIEGPREVDGVKYWKIKFDDGTVGWVAEDNLDYLRVTKTPLSKMPTLIGGRVSANRNGIPLYDSPGGRQIATENKGASGVIIEGPIVRDGVKYWHIKFDNGDQGWVSENDIDYVEDVEPNFFIKTMILFWKLVAYIKYLIILISLIFIGWVVYLYRGLSDLRTKEREALYPHGVPESFSEGKLVNQAWERILGYIESDNENDWKLAIIEADIMLDDLLDKLGLPGDTIGDKLKLIEKSDFTTLDNAWEAHKVRNEIAHTGGGFRLNQRETKRVIELYRTVFDEFQVV